MTGRGDEGFLERWSRRKQEAQAKSSSSMLPDKVASAGGDLPGEGETAAPVGAGEVQGQQAGAPSVVEVEAVNREAAEAVDLETLTYESDFSVFLKKGVPAALKNAALRKLWASNPVLANVDGLNDYDQDFRLGNQLGREFKSAWEVGRGYARKLEAMEAKLAEEQALEAAAEGEAAAAGDMPPLADDDRQPVDEESKAPVIASDASETPSADVAPEEEAGDQARPKVSLRLRMSFAEDE